MKRSVTAAMLAGIAVIALAVGEARPGTAAASNAPGWTRILQTSASGFFGSVAAISKTNVWAVGGYDGAGTVYKPYIRHFNGSDWKPVAFPAVAMTTDRVQATSASNVWVFGYGKNPHSFARTVAYRWDGAHWHRIPIPFGTDLHGSVVLGPKNVWAFGGSPTLLGDVFHWNGSTWKAYDINLEAEAIAASSASNVWLVGWTGAPKKTNTAKAYRWNGTRWLAASTPHPVADAGLGISVFSPSNVWLGWSATVGVNQTKTQAAHWDGRKWTTITVPIFTADSTSLVPDARGGYWFGPLVDWTGKSWTGVGTAGDDILEGVARLPGTPVFFSWGIARNPETGAEHPAIYRLTVS